MLIIVIYLHFYFIFRTIAMARNVATFVILMVTNIRVISTIITFWKISHLYLKTDLWTKYVVEVTLYRRDIRVPMFLSNG